jgi:PmbA protein
MRMTSPVRDSLAILEDAEFSSCECSLHDTVSREVSLEQGRLDLLRTMEESDLYLTGVRNGSRASTRISRCIESEVRESAQNLRKLADSSPSDPAFSIAPFQNAPFREKGPVQADAAGMIERLNELQKHCFTHYPELHLRRVTLNFQNTRQSYGNSNGTMMSSRLGVYLMNMIFSARRGQAGSSFNYASFRLPDLENSLHERANVDDLFRQSVEQLDSRRVPAGFTGDVVLTPNCLAYFLYLLVTQLQDEAVIRGTSLYQERPGQKIADERFNFSITPVNTELAHGSFITPDGFPAKNQAVIRKGVLKSFLLSHFGACKTGFQRAGYHADFYDVQPGDTPLQEMICSVDKGLLITRFSGGMPDENGSFSGVAKNSYYIENGKVQYPVKETMVRMNLREMLTGIRDVSFERLNLGAFLLPWIQFSNIPVE